ncbi:MAG TPA: ABC transporter substrate-binding protein, partial [Chloroflexota bacterium]|nr:ABC transporter substrate-binding protein [Chloroflexota bacterium]
MPPIDRNERARLLFHAEALDRRTRLPGQHGGCLKRTGLAVLRALLFQFANVLAGARGPGEELAIGAPGPNGNVTGRCDPSFDALARVAGVARATVAVALRRLEAAGILDRIRRQRGTVRWTNAYVFPWSRFRPQTTNNKNRVLGWHRGVLIRRAVSCTRGEGGAGMHGVNMRVTVLCLVTLVSLWAAPVALASEQPRRGGVLQVALAGDPPSLDMHQEQTFMVAIPLGPVYNNLIMFDPHNYPEIVGDLAKSWTISDDYLTYTFKLHEGVKFHDGSELTSA